MSKKINKIKKKEVEKPKLKKFFVSLAYKVPVNYEGYIMAIDENDAIRRAEELEDGDYSDEPLWSEAEPDFKINKKNPGKSCGIFVAENY